MKNLIEYCNTNTGFISAVLSCCTILLTVLTITMSYRIGRLPYQKKLRIIPALYKSCGEWVIELTLINCGTATIMIRDIRITEAKRRKRRIMGIVSPEKGLVMEPCAHKTVVVNMQDGLEILDRYGIDLNGQIIINVWDMDGKHYRAKRGFPVG